MEKEKPENKNFLQLLHDKIYSMESGNENDNENLNHTETNQNNIKKEEEIKIENEKEKENSENSYSLRANNNKKIKIKESSDNLSEYQNQKINEEEISDIIYSDKKLNIPLNNDLVEKYTSLKSVFCQNHGKLFLKINPTHFEIVCEKCIEEGKVSQLEIKNYADNNEMEVLTYNCFEHENEKGSFYCDDCKQFVCKKCFADVHREHKCHLPKVIKDEFFNDLNEAISNLNDLRPILDNSINDIFKIYDNLKKQKDETMKIPNNTLKVISSNNDSQINLLQKKTNEKFMGIDQEVHDDYFTFNGIKEKNHKFLENLKKILNDINNKENNFELCGCHKDNMEILNEINNFIEASFNFINIRLNNTNLKYLDNKKKN